MQISPGKAEAAICEIQWRPPNLRPGCQACPRTGSGAATDRDVNDTRGARVVRTLVGPSARLSWAMASGGCLRGGSDKSPRTPMVATTSFSDGARTPSVPTSCDGSQVGLRPRSCGTERTRATTRLQQTKNRLDHLSRSIRFSGPAIRAGRARAAAQMSTTGRWPSTPMRFMTARALTMPLPPPTDGQRRAGLRLSTIRCANERGSSGGLSVGTGGSVANRTDDANGARPGAPWIDGPAPDPEHREWVGLTVAYRRKWGRAVRA